MYSDNSGIASNPANGINNIPLSNGDNTTVQKSQLLSLLENTYRAKPDELHELKSVYEDFILKVQNEMIQKKLGIIMRAIDMSNDPRRQTIDPSTGQKDPTAQELALKLYKGLKKQDDYKNDKSEENLMENKVEAAPKFNLKMAQAPKKKKKTRGNPFRVLMGKIGKLLDHGIKKSDIVRYLAKQKYWNAETIEKAVDVVKEYNTKKERKTKSSNDLNVRTASEDIYSVENDYNKMSTIDLIQRSIFLMSVVDSDKKTIGVEGKEPVDKHIAKKELTKIKEALKARDYDLDLVKSLGFGGKNG
jgi:hypothetical protein